MDEAIREKSNISMEVVLTTSKLSNFRYPPRTYTSSVTYEQPTPIKAQQAAGMGIIPSN